jgi:hypothetical protein
MRKLRLATALALLAAAGVAGAEPVVEPGQTLELGDFESSGGSCDTFTPSAFCQYGVEDGRLIGVGDVANAFARAELHSFHGHEFEISASPGTAETVLATQISGAVNVRGFLAMFGLGHSRAEVLLRVIDITGVTPADEGEPLDPEEGVVVSTQTLSANEIVGSFQPSIGAEASGDVGAPHGGSVGLGISAELGLTAQVEPIRESVDFGFDVLLRRGHRYRLLLELQSSNKIGGLSALSIASFYPLLDPPNLLHPDFWTGALATLNSPGVSDLAADRIESSGGFDFPEIETSIGDFGGGFAGIGLAPTIFQPPSLFPLALAKGVPLSATSIIDFLQLDGAFTPVEEEVTNPGVELTRLAVTVEQDAIEIARNRDIEDAVARCPSRVSLYLPLEHGGNLEAVDYVVESLIARNEAAGLWVRNARRFLAASRNDAADGDYHDAYRNLCRAYGQITAIGGGG